MVIGIPKEIKTGETRVSMTPELCAQCIRRGATVVVEHSAGLAAGFTDAEYLAAGASMEATAAPVWEKADLIVKVKEPLPAEYHHFREGQALFTFLHLAANRSLTEALLARRVLAIGYETVEVEGAFPLLKPMSQIAGALAVQVGAYFLQSPQGGAGILLGAIDTSVAGNVVVIGAGNAGLQALQTARGLGATVTILDVSPARLQWLKEEFGSHVRVVRSSPETIEESLLAADLVVGAVLIPAAKAPVVVTERMIARMRPGSVVVDIAIDQGGCIEGILATSHHEPTYTRYGVVHYAVPNMPALVGRTSTLALTQATGPCLLLMVEHGITQALWIKAGLAKGVNTDEGRIVCGAVASALAKT